MVAVGALTACNKESGTSQSTGFAEFCSFVCLFVCLRSRSWSVLHVAPTGGTGDLL